MDKHLALLELLLEPKTQVFKQRLCRCWKFCSVLKVTQFGNILPRRQIIKLQVTCEVKTKEDIELLLKLFYQIKIIQKLKLCFSSLSFHCSSLIFFSYSLSISWPDAQMSKKKFDRICGIMDLVGILCKSGLTGKEKKYKAGIIF